MVGLSIAIVDDQGIVWAQGFGYAGTKNKKPATPETVYRIGSISKLFTVMATMQLAEQADFILVNHNPLDDVANIKDHRGVMTNGKWYSKSYLEKMIDPSLLPGILITGGVTNICDPDGDCVTN